MPDPPEEGASLAAVGTSALSHLEAVEKRITDDLRTESTESQRNDLNDYLESIVSAREEAKLLDLKLTESIASGSPHSSAYSLPESLESLLRLQRYRCVTSSVVWTVPQISNSASQSEHWPCSNTT